jgi:hypothetical protein
VAMARNTLCLLRARRSGSIIAAANLNRPTRNSRFVSAMLVNFVEEPARLIFALHFRSRAVRSAAGAIGACVIRIASSLGSQ